MTGTVSLTVSQDKPALTLQINPNPALTEQSVTITATVAGDPPTDTVTFYADGAATAGCSAVALAPGTTGSTATCTTTFAKAGVKQITAEYPGDGNYTQQASLAVELDIALPVSVPVPTLSQWVLALLALLLAGGAAAKARDMRATRRGGGKKIG